MQCGSVVSAVKQSVTLSLTGLRILPSHSHTHTLALSSLPPLRDSTMSEASPSPLPVRSHLITIPHHAYPHFATQIVKLRDSLSVWCGPAPPSLVQHAAAAAASDQAPATNNAIQGATAIEWAVAMTRPPTATSLFRTSAHVAAPMSQRLARKLDLPQLFLSLDLPAPLLSNSSVPQAPEDSFALLAIERGIRDACAAVLAA